MKLLIALALCGLFSVGADAVEWSAPRRLAPDTAAFVRQTGHSTDARDTALWTTWFEDRGTGRYLLKASRYSPGNESWSEPESVASDTAWPGWVETAVDAALSPWAVWSNSWVRRQGDSWTSSRPISRDTAGPYPSVCSDPNQGIWATWAELEGDSVSIKSSFCRADSWSPEALVAQYYWLLIPYTSVITAPRHGKVRSVWCSIGLCSSTWDGNSWESPEPISASSIVDGLSVCSDSAGGTWVTWSEGFSGDSSLVMCAHHDGTGWTDTGRLAIGGVTVFRGMLCCDDRGWVWALWVQSRNTADTADICVRYFDGDSWSDRSVVASSARMDAYPRIAAALGRVWVTWTQDESDTLWMLYYSHTLPSGVAEHEQTRLLASQTGSSVIRGVLCAPSRCLCPAGESAGLIGQTVLLDISGRRVADLHPGANDVRGLAPGVYFVRQALGVGREASSVFKVVITR